MHVDPELVVDVIFGSLYFNLLLKIRQLTPEYGNRPLDIAKSCLRFGPLTG